MDRHAYGGRHRYVAVVLLVAVLAAFGMAAPAHHEVENTHAGAYVLAVAAPPAAGLPIPHGAPDLPLAGAETAERPPTSVRLDRVEPTVDGVARAHRQPAADRAPPARQVTR